MEKDVALEIQHLSKTFEDGMDILNDITFSIQKNELVALIGPSGAGKSTILNVITRVIHKTSGKVWIEGREIEEYKSTKEYAKCVGMIRQRFDLVSSLSVINNVLIGRFHTWNFWDSLANLIKTKDKDMAIHALARVGIENKAYEKVARLSGGEQQRVAIARVLVQNPKIFIADEPVSSLDPERAEEVLKLLTGIARESGNCLIASMHSVELVKKHFTRVIGIRDGKVVIDAPVEDVDEEQLKQLYKIRGTKNEEKRS